MSKLLCTNCDNAPVRAKGLCAPCYQYQYQYGVPRPKMLTLEEQDELDFAGWDAWLADHRAELENTVLLVRGDEVRTIHIQSEPRS